MTTRKRHEILPEDDSLCHYEYERSHEGVILKLEIAKSILTTKTIDDIPAKNDGIALTELKDKEGILYISSSDKKFITTILTLLLTDSLLKERTNKPSRKKVIALYKEHLGIAKKSKLLGIEKNYIPVPGKGNRLYGLLWLRGAHATKLARKNKGSGNLGETEVIKRDGDDEIEHEAAMWRYYTLALGFNKHIPRKVTSLFKNGKEHSSASTLIPGYHDSIFYTTLFKSNETLIKRGIIEILFASWIFEESDTALNWGVAKNKGKKSKIYRVDFKESNSGYKAGEHIQKKFNITAENWDTFPCFKKVSPPSWWYWNWIRKLENNSKAIERKCKISLRIAMCCDQLVLQEIADAYLGEEYNKKTYRDHINKNRLFKLKEILPSRPQFREYLNNNPTICEKMITKFEKYNSQIKEKDYMLRIDIEAAKSNFDDIQEEINNIVEIEELPNKRSYYKKTLFRN